MNRRGLLSTISSVYDPLGLLAPFVLLGKQILQELCRDKANWDEEIPESMRSRWERWLCELRLLARLKIPRCYKPKNFGKITAAELHNFSDASKDGYGQCTYLRLVNQQNQIRCVLVMAKSRVAPIKLMTIPRLELTAALVSAKVNALLQRELEFKDMTQVFWTDSRVVLGYVNNLSRRFHVFVANRVQQIRDLSSPTEWRYIDTKINPTDCASRGIHAENLINYKEWWNGPEFLWSNVDEGFGVVEGVSVLPPEDPEVRKVSSFTTQINECDDLEERLRYFSDLSRAKKSIALCIRYKNILRESVKHTKTLVVREATTFHQPVNVGDLQVAEKEIIRNVQKKAFSEEIEILAASQPRLCNHSSAMKKRSVLYQLDPFLDEDGLLRVGGRIRRANLPTDVKHPYILRAIHLEVANSLDTSSFLNAYRRFVCRCGPVRQLRSDRGTNFIGGENELNEAVKELDKAKIKNELLKHNCDLLEFKHNVPHASHMGGVWERQIRTARSVLNILLSNHGKQLDDESLHTFMVEAEAIVNSRRLTTENSTDLAPLCPNNLLTMKTNIILPPPGDFQRADIYLRKCWRRVQYLANEFWNQWRKGFLQSLQKRQKWIRPKKNLMVGDIVLVTDENLPRNRWLLARVDETYPDKDGLTRKVKVMMSNSSQDKDGKRQSSLNYLERPIQKLILLLPDKENQGLLPIEEP